MQEFFASGLAADVVLAVLVIEFVILWRRGWRPVDALLLLAPAALIVVALRAALVGADWPWMALPLALAFPAHLADLARRKH